MNCDTPFSKPSVMVRFDMTSSYVVTMAMLDGFPRYPYIPCIFLDIRNDYARSPEPTTDNSLNEEVIDFSLSLLPPPALDGYLLRFCISECS